MSVTTNIPMEIIGERLTIAAPGTPQRFSTSIKLVRQLKIWAEAANTGYIYMQRSSAASGTHCRLPASTTAASSNPSIIDFGDVEIDLSLLYFDTSSANNVVSIAYIRPRT